MNHLKLILLNLEVFVLFKDKYSLIKENYRLIKMLKHNCFLSKNYTPSLRSIHFLIRKHHGYLKTNTLFNEFWNLWVFDKIYRRYRFQPLAEKSDSFQLSRPSP